MAEFKGAIPYILINEGGFSADKDDAGNAGGKITYAGITELNYPNWQGWAIIRQHMPLSWNEKIQDDNLNSLVNQFYYSEFWQKICGDLIDSQAVATYLLDWQVNSGAHASKAVQKCCGCVPDGMIGKTTLNSINNYPGDLLTDLHNARLNFYNQIGTGANEKFLAGWLKRANDLYSKLQNK